MSVSHESVNKKSERTELLNRLVDEITKDVYDLDKVKEMTKRLCIPFSDDPIQLLNNILKGIHSSEAVNGVQNEQQDKQNIDAGL